MRLIFFLFFFFNDRAPTEIYTLPLHDALPISFRRRPAGTRLSALPRSSNRRPQRRPSPDDPSAPSPTSAESSATSRDAAARSSPTDMPAAASHRTDDDCTASSNPSATGIRLPFRSPPAPSVGLPAPPEPNRSSPRLARNPSCRARRASGSSRPRSRHRPTPG